MPKRFKWSPKVLSAEMARLLDDGWDVIAYWFERWSAHKDGFIVAGPGSEAQARARESFKRLHAEGSTPSMRYHVSHARIRQALNMKSSVLRATASQRSRATLRILRRCPCNCA